MHIRLIDPRALALASAVLASTAASSAAASERFSTLEDVLSSPEFIDGCVGTAGGTILLSLEPIYDVEGEPIVQALTRELLARGVATRVDRYFPPDWQAAATCEAPAPAGPGAVVYLGLIKDDGGELHRANVVVRTAAGCRQGRFVAGNYPTRCVAIGAQPRVSGPPPMTPAPPPAVQLDRRQPPHAIGMLASSALLGIAALGFQVAAGAGENTDTMHGVSFSAFAGSALAGISAGVLWRPRRPFSRRDAAGLGIAGATLVGAGVLLVGGLALADGWDSLRMTTLAGFGQVFTSAGLGLSTAAITWKRKARLQIHASKLTLEF